MASIEISRRSRTGNNPKSLNWEFVFEKALSAIEVQVIILVGFWELESGILQNIRLVLKKFIIILLAESTLACRWLLKVTPSNVENACQVPWSVCEPLKAHRMLLQPPWKPKVRHKELSVTWTFAVHSTCNQVLTPYTPFEINPPQSGRSVRPLKWLTKEKSSSARTKTTSGRKLALTFAHPSSSPPPWLYVVNLHVPHYSTLYLLYEGTYVLSRSKTAIS